MMRAMTEFWGSGNRPVCRLLPPVRLLCGMLMIAACLLAPMSSASGIGLAISVAAAWCLLCGLPVRGAAACAAASLILTLPVFLLTPWAGVDRAVRPLLRERFLVTTAIGIRASLCLFVSAATIAGIQLSETHRALAGLPLPRLLGTLLLQILNRAVFMGEQTLWVIRGLRLRCGAARPGLRVLAAFPVVWMCRMLMQAEWTAAAMTLRGYTANTASFTGTQDLSPADTLAVLTTSLLCLALLWARLRGLP